MPISTDLTIAPFNSRFDPTQDFHRWLFQPGVSVQSRELIEIQEQFASQIERFGDNIFKAGTIVSGCNFVFLNPYPYIKLEDQTVDGLPATPSAYTNLAIMNPVTGLRAQVIDFADGFVSTDPNLKTLYLKYVNTGFDANTPVFTSGDALTIYDSIRNGIERVGITTGGQGFSNSDGIFGVSALAVTMSSGTLSNGQYIVNGLGANVQIVAIDSTSLANSGQLILSVAPRSVDLANVSVNASAWSIGNGVSFTNSGNTASGTVSGVIGNGYSGLAITDALGTITQILNLNKGVGYTTLPWITTRSTNNSGGYSSLALAPQNYVAKVRIASVAASVGQGYAFGVNQGYVYLKGGFLRVAPQTVVVSKYDTAPNNVSVVFTAIESIIDANIDPTLNDPAAGKNNDAPGADRLKVVPRLSILGSDIAASNSETLALVSWNEGNPYIQNQPTAYSSVGDAIAQTVYDGHGDFYIDPFLVTTASSSDTSNGANWYGTFDLVVDPGSAYIGGHKIQTDSNYVTRAPYQAFSVQQNYNLSLNYGNYLIVKELGGTWQFNTGDRIILTSAPKGYVSNSTLVRTSNTTPQGNQIGAAQIRGLQHLTGVPGTSSATYALYIFDVQLTPGAAFASTQGVYYNGTNKGIADVVLSPNPTTGTNTAQIQYPQSSTLVWPTGKMSIKNANGATYQFSSLDQSVTIANSGVLTKSLASAGQTFPWFGTSLTPAQIDTLYLAPTSIDLVSSTNVVGSWIGNTSTANLVANSGTTALGALVSGDWVTLIGNTSQVDLKQVTQVVNNQFVVLDSPPSFGNTSVVLARTFPKNLPIPLSVRAGVSANVSANGTLLSVNLGFPLATTTSQSMVLGAPVQVSNVSPTAKTVNRNAFVKINCATNGGNTVGPWSLGVPDIFRLRGVYVGNSTVSNTSTNYLSMFTVDNNQNPDYMDLSWLFIDQQVSSPLSGSSYILVQFDYFTTTGSGFYATPSYTQTSNVVQLLINDQTPLANLSSSASTWEVPEFFTDNGIEVDLLGCLDFRPYAQVTATPGSTPAGAPVDPGGVATFAATEKMFPVPGTIFNANLNYFVPRIDTVYLDAKTNITRIQGQSLTSTGSSPEIPPGTMKIADILIPEYPNLPANRSTALTQLLNTRIVNTKYQTSRLYNHSITLLNNIAQDAAKVYTNKDIADMDNRLRNVEYYTNLNQLESSVKTLIIPSSSDPSVNRYQFGFFADDFSTNGLTDGANPTYRATTEQGDIVPSKLTWEVYMGDEFSGAQSYITTSIISQLNATIGNHSDPTAKPQCAVGLANTVAYQVVYRNAYDFNNLPPQDGQTDLVSFQLADSTHMSAGVSLLNTSGIDSASTNNLGSGQVTLWFYSYDNPVQFQILQGNSLVADSSQAQTLSASDISNLTTGTVMNQWFNDQTGVYLKNFVISNTSYVQYAGKIVWNYSGAGGTTMTIKTTNGTGVRNWRWVVSYPINGDTAGCTPPPPPQTCPDGYNYDPITGGCILSAKPPSPVIDVVWNDCGNAGVEGLVQKILQLQASGATIGTITITDDGLHLEGLGRGDIYGAMGSISGTLQDFLNPTSIQNEVLLEASYSGMEQFVGGLPGTNFALLYALSAGKPFGRYSYNPRGSSVSYVDPSGVTSNVQANGLESFFLGGLSGALEPFVPNPGQNFSY